MSKGSKRRPSQVSEAQFEENWARIFDSNKENSVVDEIAMGPDNPVPTDAVCRPLEERSFAAWLINTCYDRRDSIGYLSTRMQDDWRVRTKLLYAGYNELLQHLDEQQASEQDVTALQAAWNEWVSKYSIYKPAQ